MRAELRRELASVPAVLGILLLFAALGFYVLLLKPALTRLEALEGAIAKRAVAQPVQRVSHPDFEAAGKLGQFYAFFQREESYVDWLARFYDMAERTGVEPRRVEYRRVEPAGVPLVLQEITIPLTGDYSRIRAFSQGVLNAIPVASLDHIVLRRQLPSATQIEAELRFTLYLPKK